MKIMVVGSGGREHAIIQKLRESPAVQTIYALPGNGGMNKDAQCIPIRATDLQAVCAFAKEQAIDFAVVGPDDPLCLGLVDELEAAGIPAFGPSKAAAEIEGSKIFSKNLMRRYGIPTAAYEVFTDADQALTYVKGAPLPLVVKADGLALGKGVRICYDRLEAQSAVRDMMLERCFGDSGSRVVIESFLQGVEASLLVLTDGKTAVPLPSAMDHKRALDQDKGLNTGGMGSVAPNPYLTPALLARCMEEIIHPTLKAMAAEGRAFKGCLFAGLMLTQDGPQVIEFNCRFGDPETQAVLSLLTSDLLSALMACANGTLSETTLSFRSGSACCVVLASGGYPQAYHTGKTIEGLDRVTEARIDYAGVVSAEGELKTAGGRVLGVTAVADTLPEAIDSAYRACAPISFEGMHYRKDIGRLAMEALKQHKEGQN